jgi:hypothetical protein
VIEGLINNATGPATSVIVTSYPADLGNIGATPIDALVCTGGPCYNSFTVSSSVITGAKFESSNDDTWELAMFTAASDFGLENFNHNQTAYIVFSPTGSFTVSPLPAALPLFASGLGALSLLGWRRKRKAIAA